MIRCKDCRGAFHLECMLGKKNNEEKGEGGGSDDDEEENVENDSDRKMPAINHGDNGVAADIEQTRDPKRCYKCVQHQQQPGQGGSSRSLILRATFNNSKQVKVKVTPAPALEACVKGKMMTVTISGQFDDTNGDGSSKATTKHVTWRLPLEEKEKKDPLCKLIDKAMTDVDDAKLQDYTCAKLRKYVTTENSVLKVVQFGGIQMLCSAMQNHDDRAVTQAGALAALAEIAWISPQSFNDTCHECLELALNAMKTYNSHAKVLQMGCAFLRALSYDAKCSTLLKKTKAVPIVVDSIIHNPRKEDVMIEGSMVLQNMMVVSPNTTITSILSSPKRRRGNANDDDDYLGLLHTLLAAINTLPNNADLAFSVFGLLANVSLNEKGLATLRDQGVYALASEAIRRHSMHEELCEVASVLLQNLGDNVNDK